MLEIKEDIYVVVCERGIPEGEPYDDGPIILETMVKNSSKESAENMIANLKGRYGKCKIGKLVFKPKMIVPDWIRKVASKSLCLESEKQQKLLRELTLGFIDADKWEIENDEDYLQF